MIKSFRGQLADGESETIRLHTNNGLTGYRIVKFQCITEEPGASNVVHVTKLYTIDTAEVTTPTGTIDFDNPLLLGVNYYRDGTTTERNNDETVIFDNVKFNQDIYITHYDQASNKAINYYLELEQVKLSVDEATVATLKDMRGTA